MRLEVALSRLIDATRNRKISPTEVAGTLHFTIQKVTQAIDGGPETIDILRERLLTGALSKQTKVVVDAKTRNKAIAAKRAATMKREGTKAGRIPAAKKAKPARASRKAVVARKARPKSNASRTSAAA